MTGVNAGPTAAGRGGWTVITLLVIAGLITVSEQFMVVGLLPVMSHELALDPVETSWILTSTLLAAAVTAPIIGRWADNGDRRRAAMVAATIISSAGSFLVAAAPSFPGRSLQPCDRAP